MILSEGLVGVRPLDDSDRGIPFWLIPLYIYAESYYFKDWRCLHAACALSYQRRDIEDVW